MKYYHLLLTNFLTINIAYAQSSTESFLTLNLLLFIVITCLLAMLVFLLKMNIRKGKQLKIITTQNRRLKKKIKDGNLVLKKIVDEKYGLSLKLAHDLKNPLSAVVSMSESAKLASKEYETIHESACRMITILDNMTLVQQFEQYKVNVNFTNKELSYFVNYAIKETNFFANTKHINVHNQIKDDYMLKVDLGLMQKTFVNLMFFAIQQTAHNMPLCLEVLEKEAHQICFIFSFTGDINNNGKISLETSTKGFALKLSSKIITLHKSKLNIAQDDDKKVMLSFALYAEKIEHSDDLYQDSTSTPDEQTILSKEDLAFVQSYITALEPLELYEASKILQIIENIRKNASPELLAWTKKLENAVFNYNETLYNKLIHMFKENS